MELNLPYSDLAGPYFALAGVSFLSLLAAVRRRKRLQLLADPSLISKTWLPERAAENRSRAELLFWVMIGAFLTAALLRPQWGYVWRDTTRRGIDLVVAVDVSESMMSADVPPNRLARARYKVRDLLEHLQGDRVGLVAFAGTAFIESPLTVDYGTFRLFLDSLTPELIPIQGTNIQAALEKSLEALGYRNLAESPEANAAAKSQAILLITDGEDFEGNFTAVGEFAAAQGVQIYIIGIGTKEGGPIPVGKGFKRDSNGKMVVTHLSENSLIELAKQTGGIYVEALGSDDDITTIYDRGIKTFLESRSIDSGRLRLWNERFQLPLLLAVILLLFGPWGGVAASISRLRTKRTKIRTTNSAAENQKSVLILFFAGAAALLCSSPSNALARDGEKDGYEGKKALVAGDFIGAERSFTDGLATDSTDPRLLLGLGESYYRLGRFKDAVDIFKRAADAATADKSDSVSGGLRASAEYNLGNSLVQLGQFKSAIESYEAALKSRPHDQETIDNLAFARRLAAKKDQQKKPEEKKPDEKNSDGKKQEEEKKDQKSSPTPSPTSSPTEKSRDEKSESEDGKNDQSQKEEQSGKQDSKSQKEEQQDSDSSRQKQDQQSEGKDDQRQPEPASGKKSEDQKQKGADQENRPKEQEQEQQAQQEQQKKESQSEKNSNENQDQPQSGKKSQGDQSSGSEKQPSAGSSESADAGESSGSGGDREGSKPKASQGSQSGGDPQNEKGDGKSGSSDTGPSGAKQSDQTNGTAADPGQINSESGTGDTQPQGNKEDGGTGKKSPAAGAADIGSGDRTGEGSDAPGLDENEQKPGEDPKAQDSTEAARMKSKGQKSENDGIQMTDDQYASPLGEDLGQSGGEGNKDRLAQKEQPGDHSGPTGTISTGAAAGGKDGPGSARAAVESFLDNVGEERGLYLKYREKKGRQQLRSEGRSAPEKDW